MFVKVPFFKSSLLILHIIFLLNLHPTNSDSCTSSSPIEGEPTSSSSSSSSCNGFFTTRPRTAHSDLCTHATDYLTRRLTSGSVRAEYVRAMLRRSWTVFSASKWTLHRYQTYGGQVPLCPLQPGAVCPASPSRLSPHSQAYTLWPKPKSADIAHQALVSLWIAGLKTEFEQARALIANHGDAENLFNFAPLTVMYGLTGSRFYLQRALAIVDRHYSYVNRTRFISQAQEYLVELHYLAQAAVQAGYKPVEFLSQLPALFGSISWTGLESAEISLADDDNQVELMQHPERDNSNRQHHHDHHHQAKKEEENPYDEVFYNHVRSTLLGANSMVGKKRIKWSKFWNQVALYRQSNHTRFHSQMVDFCQQAAHTLIHDRTALDFSGQPNASVPTMWPVEGSKEEGLILLSSSLFNSMSGADCAWGGLLTLAADTKWDSEKLNGVILDKTLSTDKLYAAGRQLTDSCYRVSTQDQHLAVHLPSKEIFLRHHPQTGHIHLHQGHEHFHAEEREAYLQGEGGFHLGDSELLLSILHLERLGGRPSSSNTKSSRWQEAALTLLTEIEEHLRVRIDYPEEEDGRKTTSGYAYHGVNYLTGPERSWAKAIGRQLLEDRMPPEWFGQTLRYLFLIFADPSQDIPLSQYVITSNGNPIPVWQQQQKKKNKKKEGQKG